LFVEIFKRLFWGISFPNKKIKDSRNATAAEKQPAQQADNYIILAMLNVLEKNCSTSLLQILLGYKMIMLIDINIIDTFCNFPTSPYFC
jgi:hypothetical protein